MTGRLRLAVAAAIALVPVGRLRIVLYRRLLGYDIGPGCRIGMLNLLACRSLALGPGSVIGRGNLLRGDFDFIAGPRLFMGNLNVVTCPWDLANRSPARGYATRVEFGADCLVNDRHYLDGHGRIRVGDGSWIAGRDSQLYTHGIGVEDRDIEIGAGCFVGSAARFAPGSGVGDRTVVGMGSVVLDRIAAEAALVAGFPARPVRDISEALAAGRYRFSREDWGADAQLPAP
jgi:acetyltransferase-like isoleucine patch superfamily enzyme